MAINPYILAAVVLVLGIAFYLYDSSTKEPPIQILEYDETTGDVKQVQFRNGVPADVDTELDRLHMTLDHINKEYQAISQKINADKVLATGKHEQWIAQKLDELMLIWPTSSQTPS